MSDPIAAPYEIVTTTSGATSIRDNVTGEIMHNPVGPWREANSLYVEQSRLADRLRAGESRELVVFDVGLGAAANALAVLHCAASLTERRPLRVVSFERDLTLLEFALRHADVFPHFVGFEGAVRALLDRGRWSGARVEWELRRGDFTGTIANEPTRAELVYYDPYSPKKNPDMWSVDTFARLRRTCDPHGALLLTYSRATPVRVALLLAGFWVGAGVASGLKTETTQASTRREDLARPLTLEWLSRWERSDAQLPPGAAPEGAAVTLAAVRAHPQWTQLGLPVVSRP